MWILAKIINLILIVYCVSWVLVVVSFVGDLVNGDSYVSQSIKYIISFATDSPKLQHLNQKGLKYIINTSLFSIALFFFGIF